MIFDWAAITQAKRCWILISRVDFRFSVCFDSTNTHSLDGVVRGLHHFDHIIINAQAYARVWDTFQKFQHQTVDGFRAIGGQMPIIGTV